VRRKKLDDQGPEMIVFWFIYPALHMQKYFNRTIKSIAYLHSLSLHFLYKPLPNTHHQCRVY